MYRPVYQQKKNGVPILGKVGIDDIAERFIRDFSPRAMDEPMEIDIDAFSQNYLGLIQDYQYLSNDGRYMGMLIFNDSNKVIIYDPITRKAEYISVKARTAIIDSSLLEEDQEPRYRFTMGHEAAHSILHTNYFSYDQKQISIFGNSVDPMIQCRTNNKISKPVEMWDDKDSMEWQANYFSSALLMPKKMVIKLIQSIPNKTSSFIPCCTGYRFFE